MSNFQRIPVSTRTPMKLTNLMTDLIHPDY